MADYGFVYILENEYMPDLVKVGCTERSPHARAEELSKGSGVPIGFRVLCYAEFEGFQSVERKMHEWLAEYRVNESREFFKGCLRRAVALLWNHPHRLSFCDASAGMRMPQYSELTMKVCDASHEYHIQDLVNPFAPEADEEARRDKLILERCMPELLDSPKAEAEADEKEEPPCA